MLLGSAIIDYKLSLRISSIHCIIEVNDNMKKFEVLKKSTINYEDVSKLWKYEDLTTLIMNKTTENHQNTEQNHFTQILSLSCFCLLICPIFTFRTYTMQRKYCNHEKI